MSMSRWQRRFYRALWLWKKDGQYPLFEWYGWLGRKLLPPLPLKSGLRMKINPADTVVSSHLWRTRDWGDQEKVVMRSLIKPGQTVLDIGANIGFFTLEMARLVGPQGKVIAFEPDAVNFGLLRQNIQLNHFPHVTPVRAAVGQRNGTATLFTEPENKGDHRLYASPGHARSQVVRIWTIDEYCYRHGLQPDFIKMDIQGYELFALQGMKKVLQQKKVRLLMEFWPAGLQAAGVQPLAVFSLLSSYGLKLYEIDNLAKPLSATKFTQLSEQLVVAETTLLVQRK